MHTMLRAAACFVAIAPGAVAQDGLTVPESTSDWRPLFDAHTIDGWRAFASPGFPASGWQISDGCLHHLAGGGGGDIITEREYSDFVLDFEWRVARGANSGVKYRIPLVAGQTAMLAPEYQVLDDANAGEEGTGRTGAAALYALYEPKEKHLAPAGEFNRSRIVARGNHLEHWLNDVCVLSCEIASPEWRARVAASKFASLSGFGEALRGRIGLQDHGDEAWFRNLRILELPAGPGEEVSLFNGTDLSGWKALGDARYSANEGALLGEIGGGGQSFLATEKSFGDFTLELDLKNELPGNSGIQVRSHVTSEGRLCGYQIEIDPSDRRWSGGLYDEARRGWLDDLSDDPVGRAAFRNGEWNHYRIECHGAAIRAWVNGVPTADYLDVFDREGLIGLQVHAGDNTRVRWKDLRLSDLGTREWVPALASKLMAWRAQERRRVLGPVSKLPLDAALRFALPPDAAEVEVWLTEGDDPRPTETRVGSHCVIVATGDHAERREFAPGAHRVAIMLGAGRIAVDVDGRRDFELPVSERQGCARAVFFVVAKDARDEILPTDIELLLPPR